MLIESSTIKEGQVVECDICVIGSGAAGISFTSEFLESSSKLVLIESGTDKKGAVPDPLYGIESTNLLVSVDSRVRAFGGTTTIWAGRWKEHDVIDFEKREWVPYSGWPITKKDLEVYYRRAECLVENTTFTLLNPRENFFKSSLIVPTFFRFINREKFNFGNNFRKKFLDASNISVFLNAHVLKINHESDLVREISVASGTTLFSVRAKIFVLACGGIENPRILLTSNVGNEHDQVGRYFMDHPKGRCGIIEMYRPIDLSDFTDSSGVGSYIGLQLSDTVQKEFGILNSYVMIEPLFENSFIQKILRRFVCKRKTHLAILRNFMEQAPVCSNRVYLSESVDNYGIPKVKIDWSISELDKKTMIILHRIFRDELERLNIGVLQSPLLGEGLVDFPITGDASHHMGTTRMGVDPTSSVVDRDCKVHSNKNLFIAGSSVFPTGGYANPTATIVALSLRLADHIKKIL
jgi:choline dehydrogenase-like flavoprotein